MQDDDFIIETDETVEGASESDLAAEEERADGKVKKAKAELETVKKERQEYLDGWQRAKADYVNAVKRFEEDKQRALTMGKVSALTSFIPAMDSLKRAEAAGEIPEAFVGIYKQLLDAANTHGLVAYGAVGEPFDPALHEALGQDPAPSPDADDTISVVLEHGWKAKDEVIRPAKVRVYGA